MYLFDDFVENSMRVIFPLTDEDVSHTLSNEIKWFTVVFVFIEIVGVVFEIDLWFSCLFLYFLKEKLSVLVSPLSDLVCDIDVGDERPRKEEITEELFEYVLGDDWGLRRDYHFEWNLCL